jgi:hypothetical protein
MATQGYGIFINLLYRGYTPEQMGLKGSAGDVTRWSTRYKLARNFRGLDVDDFTKQTLEGYNAFLQVFLTHSALERYLCLVGLSECEVETAFIEPRPDDVVPQFFSHDGEGKLFEFLCKRLNPKLKARLAECRGGTCRNVAVLSSSIRHIFAHGHLSANASDIKPARLAKACTLVSEYLLDNMDADFRRRMLEFAERIRACEPATKTST